MGTKCSQCNTDNPSDSKFCKECATPLPSSEEVSAPTETLEAPKEELTTGSTFAGRYQIIEELGKGGMGKVYKAHDTEIKEKVALKLIKSEISADKKTVERFQNELKFARKISHRNVCRMYDLNKEKGSYYITMEYVAGEDLKSMIRMTGHWCCSQRFKAKQHHDRQRGQFPYYGFRHSSLYYRERDNRCWGNDRDTRIHVSRAGRG